VSRRVATKLRFNTLPSSFLKDANACRFWPTGRGIFHNAAKTFLVWVGEEDHLRIISMQKGGDIGKVGGLDCSAVCGLRVR